MGSAEDIEDWFAKICKELEFTPDDVIGASICCMCAAEIHAQLDASARALADWRDADLFTTADKESLKREAKERLNTVSESLTNMESSGYAYVVFRSSRCAQAVHKFLN